MRLNTLNKYTSYIRLSLANTFIDLSKRQNEQTCFLNCGNSYFLKYALRFHLMSSISDCVYQRFIPFKLISIFMLVHRLKTILVSETPPINLNSTF